MTELLIYPVGCILLLGLWLQKRRLASFHNDFYFNRSVVVQGHILPAGPVPWSFIYFRGPVFAMFRPDSTVRLTELVVELSNIEEDIERWASDRSHKHRELRLKNAKSLHSKRTQEIKRRRFWYFLKYRLHGFMLLIFGLGSVGIVMNESPGIGPIYLTALLCVVFIFQWLFSWLFISSSFTVFFIDAVQVLLDDVVFEFASELATSVLQDPQALISLGAMIVSALITSLSDVAETFVDNFAPN